MFRRHFAALACALLLSVSAAAETVSPVRLVSGNDYQPFADASLPSGGLIGAIVVAAFAAADVAIDPVQFEPWKRGYADMLAGDFDATFPYIHSPERDTEVLFSDPVYDIVSVALFRAGDDHDYDGPDSLKGLILCLPIGYAASPPIDALIKGSLVRLEQPATPDLCLKQLAAGHVDVYVNAIDLVDLRTKALFGTAAPFLRAKQPVYRQSLHLIVARENPGGAALIQRFNEGLARIHANGSFDAIVKRQLGAS
jgi:polar amino acid transport system substrate-binding protein